MTGRDFTDRIGPAASASGKAEGWRRHSAIATTAIGALLLFAVATVAGQQPASRPPATGQPLYRIQVEDAAEAGLIEQELKVKPVVVRGRWFYYRGADDLNRRLRALGYSPVRVDPEEISTRVVRVTRRGRESAVRDVGATILLSEPRAWVVRATPRQLRVLTRLGYQVRELGAREPRPRQIVVSVTSRDEIAEVASRVDVYNVETTERGYVIRAGAFDDAIDELRARGLTVRIEPDPPGVIR